MHTKLIVSVDNPEIEILMIGGYIEGKAFPEIPVKVHTQEKVDIMPLLIDLLSVFVEMDSARSFGKITATENEYHQSCHRGRFTMDFNILIHDQHEDKKHRGVIFIRTVQLFNTKHYV